ncbi:MAG TPA: hypothetical protein VIJ60_06475, partial [Acidimicrobiales bacterium]
VVEASIAAHLGSPVTLTLVVDGSGEGAADNSSPLGAASTSAAPSRVGSTAAARPGPTSAAPNGTGSSADSTTDEVDEEIFDPDDVIDAVPVESVAEARVLEAFPGAEEV